MPSSGRPRPLKPAASTPKPTNKLPPPPGKQSRNLAHPSARTRPAKTATAALSCRTTPTLISTPAPNPCNGRRNPPAGSDAPPALRANPVCEHDARHSLPRGQLPDTPPPRSLRRNRQAHPLRNPRTHGNPAGPQRRRGCYVFGEVRPWTGQAATTERIRLNPYPGRRGH